MKAGDVWILGAGASAESGGPTFSEFRDAAGKVASRARGREKEALEAVLRFWDLGFRSFNVEEFFGFIDSELGEVTGEGDLGDVRKNTLFLIAKVITDRLGGGVSQLHIRFLQRLEEWVPLITLNWDILLDNIVTTVQRKGLSYVFPYQGDYDPERQGGQPRKLLKLHGSLNWLYCDDCKIVTVLGEKESAVDFLGGDLTSVACHACNSSSGAEILMVPPVLGKLQRGSRVMRAIWAEAYKVLREAGRVFIIGYSFPPTDVQTKLFISKALRDAQNLRKVKVITRPKFGTGRAQFEDRYAQLFQASEKADLLEFEYSAFEQYVNSSKFEDDSRQTS